MKFYDQLKLLLWKNWTLRKRQKTRVIMEFVWPLFLFTILWWVRTRGLKLFRPNCHVVEKALPSVGGFEFFQNFFCTLNNTCHEDYVENTGVDNWEHALIPRLTRDISPVLEEISASPETLTLIKTAFFEIASVIQLINAVKVYSDSPTEKEFVKLKNLIDINSKQKFLKSTSKSTGLSKKQLEDFLESEINLGAIDLSFVKTVSENFSENKCFSNDSEAVIKVSETTKSWLCSLSDQKKYILIYSFFNHMDRKMIVEKLANRTVVEPPADVGSLLNINFESISLILKLVNTLEPYGKIFSKYAGLNSDSSIGLNLLYESICGFRPNKNSSSFGFDPGTANNMDSLRDRLNEFKSDHHYEDDPEISPVCNNIFRRLEQMPFTSFLWRQIKPLIRGFIFYAPQNEFTNSVMEKVNERVAAIKVAEEIIHEVLTIVHQAKHFFQQHVTDIANLARMLADRSYLQEVFSILNISPKESELKMIYKILDFMKDVNIEQEIDRVDFLSELLSKILSCVRYDKIVAFETEDEAVTEGITLLSSEKLWAVIVFEEEEDANFTFPTHVQYKIRMDSDKVDSTRLVRDRLTRKSSRRRPAFDLKYITHGFVYLQEMIEHSIIEVLTNTSTDGVKTYLQQFPYPCYIYDQFIKAISRTFPMFMVLSWVYASSMIIKSIVLEKELRLKEIMKVMGLENGVIWAGWFIESFIMMSLSATVLTLILKYGKVIQHSDVTLIWVFMISFTVATICFSFLMSTFFTRANSAAAAGGVLFFVTYLPYNFMLIWEDRLEWFQIMSGCLISNVAFGFGCTYFARFEEDGVGAQWDSITLNTFPQDDFNLSYCIMMLWVDSLLYWILTWYIEAVFPGGSGVPKPWNFMFTMAYWCPQQTLLQNGDSYLSKNTSKVKSELDPLTLEGKPIVEDDPINLVKGVVVSQLGKTYSNGKEALKDLSMTFYEDQITSFLGHNGAGKTTCISILTGLFPATRGNAKIYGKDIRTEMDAIRTSLGICPQYNVLFDRLTVEEHMKFYASLKGKLDASFEQEVTQLLHDLGIPHKRHEFPKNLSGGMKRKLSVAIAFIGGSRCVFLDEPTSGVDPYSRRSIWELLLKYKQGRCIILTTHFMDEADLLGDRIAIISQGSLKACGSSLFLKSVFGQGYSLRLVRREPTPLPSKPNHHLSVNQHPTVHKRQPLNEGVKSIIKNRIPEAIVVDDLGFEVVILLPYNSLNQFASLFQDLDQSLESLGLSGYGISDTTLEDVFLKITIADLEDPETFDSLSSSSKRRCIDMLRRLRRRQRNGDGFIRKSPKVTHLPLPVVELSNPGPTVAIAEEPNEVWGPDVGVLNGNTGAQIEKDVSFIDDSINGEDLPVRSPNRHELQSHSCLLILVQVYAINLKRWWNSLRNIKAMFFEIVLPAVFIAITLAFTLILPPAENESPREMNPWTYPPPMDVFFADKVPSKLNNSEHLKVIDELSGPIGMGTACIKPKEFYELCSPEKWKNETLQMFNAARSKYNGTTFPRCSCKRGSLECSKSDKKEKIPVMKLPSDSNLLDVSKLNVPEWIEKTYKQYALSRNGGFEFQARKPQRLNITGIVNFFQLLGGGTSGFLMNVTGLDNSSRKKELDLDVMSTKVWYENKAWISSVSYLNALHNMILRERLPEELQYQKNMYGITLINHPMNLTTSQQNKEYLKTAGIGVIHAICVIFALSFVPASFTVYLIEERKCGGKHLHLVSGVKPIVYWISNFIFDVCKYFVPTVLCVILFVAFDAKAYIGQDSAGSFVCLLLLYGWASIPLMYPASYMFSIPSTAFVVLACTNLFIGVITTVSTFVLEQFGDPELERIGSILKQVFLVFPHYCLGRGLMELVKLDLETSIVQDKFNSQRIAASRFQWEYLGKHLFFLTLHGLVFFSITVLLEYRNVCNSCFLWLKHFFHSKKPILIEHGEEDEDVSKEKSRALQQVDWKAAVCVKNLTKIYHGKKRPAVNELSFVIDQGECFGLLGVNGAGKSSTFKMLTGDVRISQGHASVCGFDVGTQLDCARKHFGYCPQEDGLDPLLTAYEQLHLFGRLRGLTSEETVVATEKLIKTLGLVRYAKRPCGTYSGGNKRKMSTAIALIGDPDVVFLDEPSSGMDPGARRQLWKVILRLVRLGKSIVLTSHSMEECEALCSRLAIMVNGNLMCLGSLQHLKNRFGNGYTLTVRCDPSLQDNFEATLEKELPSAALEDKHCSQLKFRISQKDAKLGEIFKVMHSAKSNSVIEDYSVSQTTLDDIFVKFASQQKDSMDL